MTLKTQIIILVLVIVGAFSLGRYTAGKTVVKTETKTVQQDTQQDQNVHTIQKTITVHEKDGTTETIVTTDTKKDTVTNTETNVKTVDTEKITYPESKTNVSLTIGTGVSNLSPVYGVQVTHEILGPLTVGMYAQTNKTVGLSLGITF